MTPVARACSVGVVVAPILVACGSVEPTSSKPAQGACNDVELLVAASDYSSSVMCGEPGSCTAGEDLGKDPMLSLTNGRAFFVARDKDLLFEVSPSCGTPSAPLSVHPLAPRDPATGIQFPANPHDAAVGPDGTVVVPLYNVARLAFLKDGKLDGEPLDLSSFDADGNPQADAVSVVSVAGVPKAFVSLERLDDKDLLSKQGSQMLRVDLATRKIEATIDLEGRNPFNPMVTLGSALFLAEPGNFNAADDDLAGIERFDTTTSISKLLVRERDLGGSVSEVAVTDGCGAAIIAGPQKDVNPTSIVTFDPASGRAITTAAAPALGPTAGYDLYGLAWHGRTLYVGDRRQGRAGFPVHVLERTDDCKLTDTGRTIDLPQRPVALRAALHP